MRSRAEWALRAVAIAAIALLILGAMRPGTPEGRTINTRGGLERALVAATRRPVKSLDADFDSVPGPVHRDWLAAIRDAGTEVAWRAEGVAPVAIGAFPVAEPESRVRIAVAGRDSAAIVLTDALGPLDTVRVGGPVATRTLRTATGSVSASARGVRATAAVPERAQVRRVLVLGGAGWEAKFVVAALEEAGWRVDARIRVAPGVETRQGADLALDTARYSAVIALDGTAAPSVAAIERFVFTGGGAILAGTATRLPGLAGFTPATVTNRRTSGPKKGLSLAALKDDAVPLDRQGLEPMIAARRSGRGRVLASGYDETWRWRMQSAATAPDAHREWWNALVAAVAFAPEPETREAGGDPAPLAAVAAALGPESDPAPQDGDGVWTPPAWMLFALLIGSLLSEVLSRRLRGMA